MVVQESDRDWVLVEMSRYRAVCSDDRELKDSEGGDRPLRQKN